MRVAYFTTLMLSLIMVMLTGCQSTQRVVNSYKILQPYHSSQNLETMYLSCAAAVGCEFARVDNILVINENSHWPTKESIERGIIRLEGSLFSKRHQYGLSLLAGEHEIVVRFSPVSKERSESFHLIHNFLAGQSYKLSMYRQKPKGSRALLDVAIPGPLCVDLLQNNVVMRRFCRPFDALTGMGEFVEQKV
jgi:hypothetical protein